MWLPECLDMNIPTERSRHDYDLQPRNMLNLNLCRAWACRTTKCISVTVIRLLSQACNGRSLSLPDKKKNTHKTARAWLFDTVFLSSFRPGAGYHFVCSTFQRKTHEKALTDCLGFFSVVKITKSSFNQRYSHWAWKVNILQKITHGMHPIHKSHTVTLTIASLWHYVAFDRPGIEAAREKRASQKLILT